MIINIKNLITNSQSYIHYLKIFIVFSTKKKFLLSKIILASVVIFSIIINFYQRNSYLSWLGDIGRDQLVGYLIARDRQLPNVGHWNSGLGFYYPPSYYWLIGTLRVINNSIDFVYFSYLILFALSSFFFYKITKMVGGNKAAFLSTFFYSTSGAVLKIRREMLSVNWGVWILLISIYLLTNSFLNRSKLELYLGIVLFVFCTTVFYGTIVFLPFLAVLIILGQKKQPCIIFISFFLIVFSAFFFNKSLINHFGFHQTLQSLSNTSSINHANFFESILKLTDSINHEFNKVVLNGNISIISIATVILIILAIINGTKQNKIVVISLLVIILFYLFLYSHIQGVKHPHYTNILIPVYFLLFGVLIASSFWKTSLLSKICTVVTVIYLSYSFFPSQNIKKYYYFRLMENYKQIALISEKLYDGHTEYIYFHKTEDLWGSLGLWYFIETHNQTPMMELSNEFGLALTPQAKPPKTTILICDIEKEDECYTFIKDYHLIPTDYITHKDKLVNIVIFSIASNDFPSGSGWKHAWHKFIGMIY